MGNIVVGGFSSIIVQKTDVMISVALSDIKIIQCYRIHITGLCYKFTYTAV